MVLEDSHVWECPSIGYVILQRVEENVVDRSVGELVDGGNTISGEY